MLRSLLCTSEVAYYSFRLKTIDFFKLEHFKQLKACAELLITAIDVNYHFTVYKHFIALCNAKYSDLTFKPVDEILWFDHLNEISSAVLSHDSVSISQNIIWSYLYFLSTVF